MNLDPGRLAGVAVLHLQGEDLSAIATALLNAGFKFPKDRFRDIDAGFVCGRGNLERDSCDHSVLAGG